MAQLYGNKFVSNYGEADDGTWLALLKHCTRDDIKIGLRALVKISAQRARTQDEDWPPSALEFRSLCKPPRPLPSHRSFPKITKGKQTREPEFIKQRISELRNAMSK